LTDVSQDPFRYNDTAMDAEMNFPNPVVRTDLPTRRRRWPRLLAAAAILGILGIVFLPQILSSKVGRKFVVSYLSSKLNGPVTLGSFKTSWRGGTSVQFLSIPDPMGRTIGCKSLVCQASLWKLLRGKYQLGETVIEGLHVDWVVDDGRGGDTADRFQGPPGAGSGGGTSLPSLSGKITINSGTIVLHRGTVQPKLYDTTWEQGRLENLEASFDIQSLDRPWTYTFAADSVEGDQPRGTITSAGTIDLGQRADPKQLKVDLTISGEKVWTGGLGAALVPASKPDDIRQALGANLAKIDIALKAADGKLQFQRCEAVGTTATIRIKPSIDLTATPVAILSHSSGEPGLISLGVSKRLAQQCLVYFNPFLREAAGGRGSLTLTIDQLKLPLGARQWARGLAARGRLTAKNVVLDRNDEMTANQNLPDNLASQLALLTGDSEKTVSMSAEGEFNAYEGRLTVSPMTATLRDTTLVIQGAAELDSGAIDQTATLATAPAITSLTQSLPAATQMAISIGGTIRQPVLGVLNLAGSFPEPARSAINDRIAQQTAQMRASENRRLMQKSQQEVQEILRPLQGPATMPAVPGTRK
jgi:hypothetical protein